MFKTLSSISRSRSLLGALAPAAVRASTPATCNTSESFSTKAGKSALERMNAEDAKFWRRFMWMCGFSCVSYTFGQFLDNDRRGSRPCPICSSNGQHGV